MRFSLRTKTFAGIILLALVLSTISVFFSYRTYKESMNEHYYERGSNVVKTVASQLDSKVLDSYYKRGITEAESAELMNSEQYQEYLQFMVDVGDANDVTYLYVVRPTEEGAYYLFDTDLSLETNCPLGYFEQYYEGAFLDNKDRFLAGEFVEPIISDASFGWLLSAFYPMKLDGEMVAYICVDISMDEVMTDRESFLRSIVVMLAAVTVAFVLYYLWLVNGKIVRPINQLALETTRFIAAKNSTQEIEVNVPVIRTGDEIENLAEAIQTMERDIDHYIENLKTVTAEKERIEAELNIAAHIQASMLPSVFSDLSERTEFDLYASMNPAREVGGDFYDFFLVDDDHLALVIADVSGKGVPAALFMVITKTLLKNEMQVSRTPKEVFDRVNIQLCENSEDDMFVTAWIGIYEISTGLLTYVNAGHNPPLLKKANGEFESLGMFPGFVLAGMEDVCYEQEEILLESGDVLYLYTDGVVEAMDANHALYGVDRLKAVLNRNGDLAPETLLKRVKEDVDVFVGGGEQFDDITMVGVRIEKTEKR